MRNKSIVVVLGLAAAALALPAAAQMRMPSMSSAYVGGSIGQSKFKIECDPGFTCDDKDTAFRLFGGFKFSPNISAELGYADLGKSKISGFGVSAELKATAWDLSALLAWPVSNEFSIFGRLGGYRSEAKFGGAASGSKTGTGVTWGLGAQYDVTRNLGVRGEWQRYSKVKAQETGGTEDKGDIDALSVGVVWRFQ
jgi:OOP family OmpA-OmpF porin